MRINHIKTFICMKDTVKDVNWPQMILMSVKKASTVAV